MAATFNREIARRSAEATAYETRAVSVPWTYSPTVDLGRDARWPRIWENFGEDCYLNSEMGKAMVYGFQGEDPNNIDQYHIVSVPWTYSPTVDLGRDARWPRIWENFGEDCYLNSEMGKAMVYGFQGDDPNNIDQYHIATSMKHFMGYGVPWTGKDRTPAYISPADLRE